ncbi:hypothetical protein BC936DRAFT_147909 [Jimgerdemannia flammicorona]|uniref:PPM-type phosphatase domain-containing protein n=1 Tax=Jimgerdemannia flammicorona TaxID=994334 RepID=A0A433D489_9FUNG|nr:hypothetical protein BC936DRAFT_147909 [Jimgerdemannia flammicorona]
MDETESFITALENCYTELVNYIDKEMHDLMQNNGCTVLIGFVIQDKLYVMLAGGNQAILVDSNGASNCWPASKVTTRDCSWPDRSSSRELPGQTVYKAKEELSKLLIPTKKRKRDPEADKIEVRMTKRDCVFHHNPSDQSVSCYNMVGYSVFERIKPKRFRAYQIDISTGYNGYLVFCSSGFLSLIKPSGIASIINSQLTVDLDVLSAEIIGSRPGACGIIRIQHQPPLESLNDSSSDALKISARLDKLEQLITNV